MGLFHKKKPLVEEKAYLVDALIKQGKIEEAEELREALEFADSMQENKKYGIVAYLDRNLLINGARAKAPGMEMLIRDYNKYCKKSGHKENIIQPSEYSVPMTEEEVNAYAAWLQETVDREQKESMEQIQKQIDVLNAEIKRLEEEEEAEEA